MDVALTECIGIDNTIDIREWLQVKEAAFRLGKTSPTIKKMAKDGRLRGVVYGGGTKRQRLRIDPASLVEFLARAPSDGRANPLK